MNKTLREVLGLEQKGGAVVSAVASHWVLRLPNMV